MSRRNASSFCFSTSPVSDFIVEAYNAAPTDTAVIGLTLVSTIAPSRSFNISLMRGLYVGPPTNNMLWRSFPLKLLRSSKARHMSIAFCASGAIHANTSLRLRVKSSSISSPSSSHPSSPRLESMSILSLNDTLFFISSAKGFIASRNT